MLYISFLLPTWSKGIFLRCPVHLFWRTSANDCFLSIYDSTMHNSCRNYAYLWMPWTAFSSMNISFHRQPSCLFRWWIYAILSQMRHCSTWIFHKYYLCCSGIFRKIIRMASRMNCILLWMFFSLSFNFDILWLVSEKLRGNREQRFSQYNIIAWK